MIFKQTIEIKSYYYYYLFILCSTRLLSQFSDINFLKIRHLSFTAAFCISWHIFFACPSLATISWRFSAIRGRYDNWHYRFFYVSLVFYLYSKVRISFHNLVIVCYRNICQERVIGPLVYNYNVWPLIRKPPIVDNWPIIWRLHSPTLVGGSYL